ncbi:MAG TPA: hypothetical protein V6D19_24805 [Stenomitos sp.]
MSSNQPEHYISFTVRIAAHHPDLLEGLEDWIRLGLLSDLEVRGLCRQHLVCAIPEPVLTPVAAGIAPPNEPSISTATAIPVAATPPAPQRRGGVSQFLEGLITEVSVIWLLGLGVFLVVVSSAILAASQWQSFPPEGQYGILLSYTIAFVITGLWTGKNPQLQRTAGMLQIASLLIIPVNFWMMDGFHLLQSISGIGIASVAAIVLSGATWHILRPSSTSTYWIAANAIGLSWLHWGWSWPHIPLIAAYIGCIGTSVVRFVRAQHLATDTADLTPQPWWQRIVPGDVLLIFAVLLLLFRAIAMAAVPLEQLGLALGTCGWVLCWLARTGSTQPIWAWSGIGLMLWGWTVSVSANPPWQAFCIGILGLWLLGDRLIRLRTPSMLVALLVVALVQGEVFLQLVPLSLRARIVGLWIVGVGPQGLPEALMGLHFFPYLVGVLTLNGQMKRWQQPALVATGNVLAWILGTAMVLFSLENPILRSLALLLATATLGVVIFQRRTPVIRRLVYSSHFLALLTAASILDNLAPAWSWQQWGIAALVGTLLEWCALLALGQRPLWQQSTWLFGLALAGLGYLLLFSSPPTDDAVMLMALSVPTLLSALLFVPQFRWTNAALGFSVASTITAQALTFDGVTPRLIGLGMGTILMLLNLLARPQGKSATLIATFGVGFGLTFAHALGWEVLPHHFTEWLLLCVGLLVALWGLRHLCQRQSWPICTPLKLSLDGWAIALVLVTSTSLLGYGLLGLSGASFWHSDNLWPYTIASVGLTAALIYRYWQGPTQGWLVGVAWTFAVTLIIALAQAHQTLTVAAIALLALAMICILLGEKLAQRSEQSYGWAWHLMPLGYAALGWLLSNAEWTAASGLYTLALAFVMMAVGRRKTSLVPIGLLGVMGVSVGAFELLLYALLQAKGGQPDDGWVALAGLALGLAITDQVLKCWGSHLLRLPPRSLSVFGHLHWGLGTLLLAIACVLSLSKMGQGLWTVEMIGFSLYALAQGKRHSLWTYAAIIEIWAAIGQTFYTQLPDWLGLTWGAAIAAGIALGLYSLPWRRWGWPQRPFWYGNVGIPVLAALLTSLEINISSLLIVGGFYAWMAVLTQTPRLSYVGLIMANWAGFRLLETTALQDSIWKVSLVGLSILYLAQVDPALRSPTQREVRHWLRCFAIGLIGTTALYESDTSFVSGLLTIGLSLGLIALGLVLRVRALLYVGTLLFLAKVLRVVWLFITDESVLLWALGIALGLGLIWMAATFEARRSQMTALVQYWAATLDTWE